MTARIEYKPIRLLSSPLESGPSMPLSVANGNVRKHIDSHFGHVDSYINGYVEHYL